MGFEGMRLRKGNFGVLVVRRIGCVGQVGLEYMMVVATLLVLTAVMMGYTLPAFNSAVKSDQLNTALIELSLSADKAYSLGPGSVIISEVVLPEGVDSFTVLGGNKLEAVFDGSSTVMIFDFNISGSIPVGDGFHRVSAAFVDGNIVFSEVV